MGQSSSSMHHTETTATTLTSSEIFTDMVNGKVERFLNLLEKNKVDTALIEQVVAVLLLNDHFDAANRVLASLNTENSGNSLFITLGKGDLVTADTLVKAGASVDHKVKGTDDNDFVTSLFVAAENGEVGSVLFLLSRSASMNVGRVKGGIHTSPLYIATYNGHLPVVLILEHGASDTESFDSLKVARDRGHTHIVDFLEGRGSVDLTSTMAEIDTLEALSLQPAPSGPNPPADPPYPAVH